jgi:hypothetical protein
VTQPQNRQINAENAPVVFFQGFQMRRIISLLPTKKNVVIPDNFKAVQNGCNSPRTPDTRLVIFYEEDRPLFFFHLSVCSVIETLEDT